jgi:sugar transferase (PEP-CTERM system associated)
VLIFGAVGVAAWFMTGETSLTELIRRDRVLRAGLIAFICQACLYYSDLYDFRAMTDRREMFISIVQALGAASFLLALVYFFSPDLTIGRGVFMVAAIMVAALVLGWRILFEWLMRRAGPRERLLLVGTGAGAVALAREMFERRNDLGVDIVGFVDPDPTKVGSHVINPGVIGTIEDIPSIVRARNVDRVVVSLGDARGALPMNKLLEMKLDGVAFDHLASVYEELTGKIAVENLRPSWLIFSSGFRKSHVLQAGKRAMDLVGAAAALIVTAPLLVVIAAAVKWSSPGPVMYRQQRVGFQGRVFTVFKFRSMCANAEAATGAVWAQQNDERITGVGRVLRRTRLDELPQLLNVLRGEMSLVGPRPERPEFVSQLTKEIPFYGQRHVVRPGLTGWAQVCYTYGASVEDAMEKLQYDLFYIKNLSIPLDIFIIFSTIKTVLLSKGAR